MEKGILRLLSGFIALTLISFHADAASIGAPPTPAPPAPAAAPPVIVPKADSTYIAPPGLRKPYQSNTQWPTTSVGTRYPGVSVPTTPVTNEQYANLPACPATIACPDINGTYPPGTSAVNCPDTCTVKRTVTTDPNNTKKINSTTPAICPKGYTAVATYLVDKEIGVAAADQAAPYPIPDMTTYNDYLSSGYTCQDSAQITPHISCAPDQSFDTTLVGVSYGGVGRIFSYISDPGCYAWNSQCAVPVSAGCLIRSMYYFKTFITYVFKKCYFPKGSLYYTGNMVPTGVVCSVAQPVWRPLNQ